MKKFIVLCFVFVVVASAFSALPRWRCTDILRGVGGSIEMSGDYLAVPGSEEVSLYHRMHEGWVLDEILKPEEPYFRRFGRYVSISHDLCVVSASFWLTDAVGYALVYRLENSNWVMEQILAEPNMLPYFDFSTNVSVDGDLCAISSRCDHYEYCSESRVHLYRYDGQRWLLDHTFSDSGRGEVCGDRCAVLKCYFQGRSTGICIYYFDGQSWIKETEFDLGPDFFESDFAFGDGIFTVTMSDEDSTETEDRAVYIYGFNGTDWQQDAKLISPMPENRKFFGCKVIITDDTCIVGAGDSEVNYNGVYVYELLNGNWTLTARFDKSVPELMVADFNYTGQYLNNLSSDGKRIVAESWSSDYRKSIFTFDKCSVMDLDGDCVVGVGDLQVFADEWLTGRR